MHDLAQRAVVCGVGSWSVGRRRPSEGGDHATISRVCQAVVGAITVGIWPQLMKTKEGREKERSEERGVCFSVLEVSGPREILRGKKPGTTCDWLISTSRYIHISFGPETFWCLLLQRQSDSHPANFDAGLVLNWEDRLDEGVDHAPALCALYSRVRTSVVEYSSSPPAPLQDVSSRYRHSHLDPIFLSFKH